MPCAPPPPLKTLTLNEVGDSFASLQWNTSQISSSTTFSRLLKKKKYSDKYFYSLTWNPQNNFKSAKTQKNNFSGFLLDFSSTVILPSTQTSVMIAGLTPNTNYYLSLFAYNNCAKTSKLAIRIATQGIDYLHGKHNKHRIAPPLLPHEMILIGIVFVIWFFILRHALQTYKKFTGVNVLPAASMIEISRSSFNQKNNDIRRISSISLQKYKTSNVSSTLPPSLFDEQNLPKKSLVNQFDILEDAVCAWRSETLLSTKNVRDRNTSCVNPTPKKKRSSISMIGMPESSDFKHLKDINFNKKRNSDLAVKIYKKKNSFLPSTINSNTHQVVIKLDSKNSSDESLINASLLTSNQFPKSIEDIDLKQNIQNSKESLNTVDHTQIYAKNINKQIDYKTSKNRTGPRKSVYVLKMYDNDNIAPRKISDVLLGKATNDIRRCSQIYKPFKEPFYRRKPSLRRRLSNIGSSIPSKLSFKRKTHKKFFGKMGSLKEEK